VDDAKSRDGGLAQRVAADEQASAFARVLSLRDEIGAFGELVYAGMDWLDPKLARRSMELMATEVMPRVNRAIGTSPAAAAAISGRH